MGRTRRSELFWLLLIAACVALFAYQREQRGRIHHDRVATAAQDPNADIVTGSITPARKPAAAGRYYVPLGSYGSIAQATRRYLDVAERYPALERDHKLKINTVKVKGDGTFHRVRMGNFVTEREARVACSEAGLSAARCPVVALR
ncbi:SPOR domain-containing protein [Parvibaculum sp.]|uniref:SPOR domain-containing protein n=1 Tax=Parvibaculum sp. TaxID=2024848 RepID=UPI00320ED647